VGTIQRLFFALVQKIATRLFPRMRVEGYVADAGRAAIFVSNHQNSYGPLAMMLRFPIRLFPWVLSDVTERGSCSRYVERDFVRKELHLGRPLSRAISLAIELICVPMMRYLEVVPVYHRNRKIERTFELSRVFLNAGRSLVIFPELDGVLYNDVLNKLDNGFLEVLRQAYLADGRRVSIYPVFVDRRRRLIRVGKLVDYDPENSFRFERHRIEGILEEEMSRLARSP
jgi:hypothetical protein